MRAKKECMLFVGNACLPMLQFCVVGVVVRWESYKKKSCCGVAILVRWRMYVYIYSCSCGVDILVRWEMYVYIYSSWCACAGVALVDTLCVPDLGIRNGNQTFL